MSADAKTDEQAAGEQDATQAAGVDAAADPLGDFLNAQAEVDNLRAERSALFEKLARAQADFANSRRRIEADFEQRFAYANQGLITGLLPIIDNFERALAVDPATADAATLLKGMQMVHDQWLAELAKFDVAEVAPAAGDEFDPAKHVALMQQESDHPEGRVVRTLQKGYTMKGRTLRAAQVAVSRAK